MKKKDSESLLYLKEKLNEIEQNPFTEAIIKDNRIPFNHEKKLYRCVMPSQSNLMNAKDYEDETRVRLLRKKDSISKVKLIKLLKKNQDIDIEKFEKDRQKIISQINEVYLTLNRVSDLNKDRIDELTNKIQKLVNEFQNIGYQISKNLSSCIENKQEVAFIRFLTSRCTEIQDSEGNWTKVWKEFENFENDNSTLTFISEYWFSRLYTQTRS